MFRFEVRDYNVEVTEGELRVLTLRYRRRSKTDRYLSHDWLSSPFTISSLQQIMSNEPEHDFKTHPIVFFDGVCGLCNHTVDFVLSRDTSGIFRFAPLQGETAQQHLPTSDIEELKTIVVLDEQGLHRHSTAVVILLKRLGGGWRLMGGLLWIIPRPLRNVGYRLVSRFRYLLFGKKETCRMPTADERDRFLP